jgi:hypothetical protein
MNVHDINKEILNSKDLTLDDIDLLFHTVRVKQVRLSNAQIKKLGVGDRVRFTNIKPKYMIGETGAITGFRGTKIFVKLDRPNGRFSSGSPILVPATCVVKEEE